MDLLSYLGKRVRIVLPNGFYYIGSVIDANKTDITLIDKNGQRISLKENFIMSILEVK